MEYLHLEVSNSVIEGKTKRTTKLREDGYSKNIEIFYEFDRVLPWSNDTLLDGNIFAILLYAASRGKNLKVHGVVSHAAMRNIEELLLAWSSWKPEIYKKIEIIPDRISKIKKTANKEASISAFSGGVDSIFTALRHSRLLSKEIRYPLTSVLMVHGFDVDIYNIDGFKQLTSRTKPFLDDLGLELRTVRTNSRDLKLQDWDDSHALELAACLHMYYEEFDFGLIGSSDPYNIIDLPWGSNPVTDHLISGNQFSIIHDGAGFSRTEKVVSLLNFPIACQVLKVCWDGADQSRNCGKCEKCVSTQLNFLAAGAKHLPSCFPKNFNPQLINSIKIHTNVQLLELTQILDYAESKNIRQEWVSILKERVSEWKPAEKKVLEKEIHGRLIKRILAKFITIIGLDAPAKKIWRRFYRLILK